MPLGRGVHNRSESRLESGPGPMRIGQLVYVATSPPASQAAFCRPEVSGSAGANDGSDSDLRDCALSRRVQPVCEGLERTERPEWLAPTVINRHREVNRIVTRVLTGNGGYSVGLGPHPPPSPTWSSYGG